jgi:hypothetical protein
MAEKKPAAPPPMMIVVDLIAVDLGPPAKVRKDC